MMPIGPAADGRALQGSRRARVVVAAVVALVLSGCSLVVDAGGSSDASGDLVTIASLAARDCFDPARGDVASFWDTGEAFIVRRVDCEGSHGFEVFATSDLEDASFPGESELERFAEAACLESFEAYVGEPYETSPLDVGWVVPTATSWGKGDRRMACLLYALDLELLEGSMAASGTGGGEVDGTDDAVEDVAASEPPVESDVLDRALVRPEDLDVGVCFDDPTSLADEEELPEYLEQRSCDEPHDNEVFDVIEHPLAGGEYPQTDVRLYELAEDSCVESFDTYVGRAYMDSSLYLWVIVPTEAAWELDGDVEVACVLFEEDAKLVGSMAGAAR